MLLAYGAIMPTEKVYLYVLLLGSLVFLTFLHLHMLKGLCVRLPSEVPLELDL